MKQSTFILQYEQKIQYQTGMDSRKNIVVTGGNTGIGLETARALYGDGHNIIFGSRNQQKNADAAKSIIDSFPQSKGTIKWFKLDLSKRTSIEEFSENVKKQFGVIDILVNNAGMVMSERQLNEWGIQMTMVVNHFGPFYLTYLLFPHIKKSKEARIINVASSAQNMFRGSTSQDNSAANGWNNTDFYAKSKLANVQFTVGLAKRLQGYPNIKTMSLHPGLVDSEFFTDLNTCNILKFLRSCCCCFFVNTQTGARTNLYLARQPFESLRNGEYYDSDTSLGSINPLGADNDHVERLWKVSEEVFRIQFNP